MRQSQDNGRLSIGLRAVLHVGTMLSSSLAVPALAQTAPPLRLPVDENGVDLATGEMTAETPAIVIGGGQTALRYQQKLMSSAYLIDPYAEALFDYTTSVRVWLQDISRTFTLVNGVWVSDQADGSTLSVSNGVYTFTNSEGVIRTYSKPSGAYVGALTSIAYPTGERLQLTSRNGRFLSVSSNFGYILKYSYLSNDPQSFYYSTLSGLKLINSTVDYCDPAADVCSTTQQWPSFSRSSTSANGVTTTTFTDSLNQVTTFTFDYTSGRLIGIKRPGSISNDVSIGYDGYGRVTSVAVPGHTTNYSWSLSGSTLTGVTSDSTGTIRTTTANTNQGLILTSKDGLNRQTNYTYDGYGRLSLITYPEGNKVQFTYDARGNVTEKRLQPKAAGPADIVMTSGFDAMCSSSAKCNQPNWTKDALGNQTDYTYNTTTGQLLTVTQPAAVAGGTRPKATYGYTSRQAYYKNSVGSIVASGQPISVLTSVSTCLTGASCAGTSDEAKTVIDYGPQTAGVANNLLPLSVTNSSGDNAIVATTTLAYDAVGNVTSADGPLSGTGDTTVYRYDALRRRVGVMGPDPDGTGSLQNTGSRTTYDTKGRVTLVEQGYTAGQTTTAWNAFTPAASVATTYDPTDRKLTETLKNGTTAYGLTQYSYDARGRLDCAAVRMNPAIYGSLPASACTLGAAGSNGADRVTKHTYDVADQVTLVQTAYGTADQANEKSLAYTPNGQLSYVIDANLNRTTYEYDGHDRLVKMRFPVATKGANSSSTTDYEQLIYGDNVHVTQRRLRDGNTISFSYDNLDRVTGMSGATIAARTFSYNLQGMQTGATFTSGGQSVTNTFDALGRVTSQVTPQGTVGYQYDAASRRTRITWPDSLYLTYDYDTAGKVTAIRENGAASGIGVLASYSYDSLGRRTGVTYGNGTSRTFAYDAVSRTTGIKIDPVGTTNDLVIGGVGGVGTAVSYNPASQIIGLAKNNDAYAWTGHYNFNRGYTTNGLNQYTASGATSLGYDARGNLTSSGGTTYAYNGLNQLTSVSGGPSATLAYDPADRLYQLAAGGVTTRYLYDGVNMIGEYNGSNALLRRFVPGPGTDEPIVWYEGSSTADRRWLQADERGSVVAISDASGNAIGLNRYDEYGIPQSTNLGRFQYTGQVWLGEVGMYYYKARFYSPTLGRFMQTDPIGYADGMNWYNYVGSDPVNRTDPSGKEMTGPDIIVTPGQPFSPHIDYSYLRFSDFDLLMPSLLSNIDLTNGLAGLGADALAAAAAQASPKMPQKQQPGQCSAAVGSLLSNKDVQSAISDAVKLGLSTPNWGGGPHSEAGFWGGRGLAGGVNVGGVYSSGQARTIEVRGGDALLAGAFFDKTFFHLHLGGTGPSDQDRGLADSVLFGTGANIVSFDRNGKVKGCYAGG